MRRYLDNSVAARRTSPSPNKPTEGMKTKSATRLRRCSVIHRKPALHTTRTAVIAPSSELTRTRTSFAATPVHFQACNDSHPLEDANLGVDGDDVPGSSGGGDGVAERHEHGGHEDRELLAVGGQHGRAQQLDGRLHHLGVLEVDRGQGRDSLALDLLNEPKARAMCTENGSGLL